MLKEIDGDELLLELLEFVLEVLLLEEVSSISAHGTKTSVPAVSTVIVWSTAVRLWYLCSTRKAS